MQKTNKKACSLGEKNYAKKINRNSVRIQKKIYYLYILDQLAFLSYYKYFSKITSARKFLLDTLLK